MRTKRNADRNDAAGASAVPTSDPIAERTKPSTGGKRRSAGAAKKRSKARKVLEKPEVLGWETSDDDEIRMRQWRGRAEIASIEALEPDFGPYGAFRVRSTTGGAYDVEIRDLVGRTNSCGCVDHRVNGLGTCKHIEGVLAALRKKGRARLQRGRRARLAARRSLPAARGRARPGPRRPALDRRAARLSRSLPRQEGRADLRSRRRSRGSSRPRPSAPAGRPRSRAISAPGSSAQSGSRRGRQRGRKFLAAVERGRRQLRRRQIAAPALSAAGRGAPRLQRTGAARRRDGARQDRAGHRRLRDSGAREGDQARARRLADLGQGRVGGADRALHRPRRRASSPASIPSG